MNTKDNQHSTKVGDRIIAAVIVGIFGYFVGGLLASAGEIVLGDVYGLRWLVVGGFSLSAFSAPARPRELWASIWASSVRFYGRIHGWRGWYITSDLSSVGCWLHWTPNKNVTPSVSSCYLASLQQYLIDKGI